MADLRFDPLNQTWVAVARNRMQRPSEYVPMEQVQTRPVCPFCRGYEDETPGELASYDAQGQPLQDESDVWSTRVIPNKYPSLGFEDTPPSESGPFDTSSETGQQELIIPSPRHIDSFSDLTANETRIAMLACRDRFRCVSEMPTVRHAMLFMNCRSAAGASLSHIHLQLIGSPVLGPALLGQMDRNAKELQASGKTLVTSLAEWERDQAVRVVAESERFVAFCPFASRFPLQLNIVPKVPSTALVELDDQAVEELGQFCHTLVGTMEVILGKTAYNILFHVPPVDAGSDLQRGAWYVEIFPRITRVAGFEWGTQTWVNPVSPESAAKRIKAVQNEGVR